MIWIQPTAATGFVGIAVIPRYELGKFEEMVQRATNLWPDAPPEIKEFADLVTNGRIMQDYRRQVTGKKEGE